MPGFRQYVCAGLVAVTGVAVAGAAHAEGATTATVKGTVGGALLGGEAVMLTEAAIGVKPAWAYAVGGGIGAVAGGVGGLIIENDLNPKVSLYMLVGGMALAIPTTVAVLSVTAYEPVNYVEDRPVPDEPVAEPARGAPTPATPPAPATAPAPAPAGGAAPPSSSAPRPRDKSERVARVVKPAPLPPALVGLAKGTLTLSLPAVEVRHVFTRTEVAMFGVKQQTEVSVPVFNAVF
jgi:hypothetical protein